MNTPRRVGTGFALTFGLALALLIGPSCSLLVSTSGLADAPGATDASEDRSVGRDGEASDVLYAADAGIEFYDTFERPDSLEIGNGWIEKDPKVFELQNGAARQVVLPTTFTSGMVFRPVAESAADVELRAEVASADGYAYPRLVARLDPPVEGGGLRAYVAVIVLGEQELRVERADGSSGTLLAKMKPLSAFEVGTRYRLHLRVAGASTVTLAAWVVDVNSGNELARVSTLDASNQRIDKAGSVGFVGDDQLGLTYHDFAYTRW